MPVLPNVTATVKLDDSAFPRASAASAKAHAAMQGHTKTSSAANLKFTDSLKSIVDRLGGLPPIAGQVGQSLESMTGKGVTGMGLLGGAALAGAGLVAAVLGTSIGKYTELAEHVENYKRVTGASAEESGKMVQTFEALGVSEETATQGAFKLSKAIEKTPKQLADLGIFAERDAKGNVDLSKTLFAVADAYNATVDPARKNLILFEAFGKSGKDMIPILEQGSVALRNLEAAARISFSDEDLQRAKDYKIQLHELQQGWDAIWESVGQKVVPVLDDAMNTMSRTDYGTKKLKEALDKGTLSWGDYQKAMLGSDTAGGGINKRLKDEYDAGHKAKGAIDDLSQATQQLAKDNEDLWAKTNKVIAQQQAQAHAGFALERAEIAVSESQGKVNTAQENYDAALKKFGPNADETLLALNQLKLAGISQEEAYLAVGAAARKLQEDTDQLGGGSKNFVLDTEAEIDALQKEADKLAPDSPLRARLRGWINTLKNDVPAKVASEIYANYHISALVEAHHAAVDSGYAEGGRPPVGRDIWVGENGPERVRFDQPGTITPHGTSPTPAPATGGDNLSVVVHAQTNADAHDIAVDAAWELRKMRRNF